MTVKQKILVVDDDANICDLICLYLDKEGYETIIAKSGNEAIKAFSLHMPDLVLLDVMLPEKDGFTVLSELRKSHNTPVIMLTAKGETFDKVLGLSLGADDYIVKPFDNKEMVARIKAVLRRTSEPTESTSSKENIINFKNMSINQSNYTVLYHETNLELPPKEFEIILFFAKHPNQVFTRDALLNKIWGYDFLGDTRTVDVHIKRIREKMDRQDPFSIKTVWGIGYKFEVL